LPRHKIIWKFLDEASQGKPICLQQPIGDRHNLVHARDVARACLLALSKKTWGVFNVGAADMTTIEQIARTCVSVTGSGRVSIDSAPPVRTATSRFDLDCTKAKKKFGYQQSVVLPDGIRDLWQRKSIG
jgi:UDP-glucose 4-epimerase